MARITVEDCTEKVTDRFKLVALASERAKSINGGAEVTIDKENKDKQRRNKAPVIALREIAAGNVTITNLEQGLIKRLRVKGDTDPANQDISDELTNENIDEDIDYLPTGLDVSVNQDYSDLDSEMFSEVDIDDDTTKTFEEDS